MKRQWSQAIGPNFVLSHGKSEHSKRYLMPFPKAHVDILHISFILGAHPSFPFGHFPFTIKGHISHAIAHTPIFIHAPIGLNR
jgi:hypothetical protein